MLPSEEHPRLIRLRVPASPEYIAPVRGFLKRVLRIWLGEKAEGMAAYELLVALQEAVTNVIRHAYRGAAGDVEIEARRDPGEETVEIHLRDWGAPFEPEAVPLPDFEHPRPGGYGLYIIRRFTDECAFAREGPANTLRVVKRFRTPSAARVESA